MVLINTQFYLLGSQIQMFVAKLCLTGPVAQCILYENNFMKFKMYCFIFVPMNYLNILLTFNVGMDIVKWDT